MSYSFICLACLTSCKQCKKQEKEKVTISGYFYKNCNTIANNTTYYLFPPPPANGYTEITTDANGYFSFEADKYMDTWYNIYTDNTSSNLVGSIKFHGEALNIGIIRESASNQLILKLKTNHLLTNLDTIKYVFQYNTTFESIHGPITKDTIIGIYTKSIAPNLYNDNPTTGEQKTLWWNFGQTTSTNQVQVDYTIHGCAGVADTAYIVVP
jgi:hypothetical protein